MGPEPSREPYLSPTMNADVITKIEKMYVSELSKNREICDVDLRFFLADKSCSVTFFVGIVCGLKS